MVQHNPFSKTFDAQKDVELIAKAIKGNRLALNTLMKRHQNFIFNIALKMLGNEEDAKDVTQDILIKVMTNLSSFDTTKAQFRTWLYRIAFNHILNYKKSKPEQIIVSFNQFFDFVATIEDDETVEEEELNPLSNEAKIKCMSGMLMCIPREDRLLYIVGDFFKIDHNLGAEIFNISSSNFRKKLSRIRKDLRQWMNNKCGLVNKNNPCRCARKTKGFIEKGIVNPNNLMWEKGFSKRIETFTNTNMQDILRSSDEVYSQLYRQHPFKETMNAKGIIDEIISDDNIREVLDF